MASVCKGETGLRSKPHGPMDIRPLNKLERTINRGVLAALSDTRPLQA